MGDESACATIINSEACLICGETLSSADNPLQNVVKGLESLVQYSLKTENNLLKDFLHEQSNFPETQRNIKLHRKCQKKLYNDMRKRKSAEAEGTVSKKSSLRSTHTTFNWKNLCLFCREQCAKDPKHPDRSDCHQVETLSFRRQVLAHCENRNDQVATAVHHRVINCIDLVQVEARYHNSCRIGFFRVRGTSTSASVQSKGRPVAEDDRRSFEMLCEWLEGEAELYTVGELQEKMAEVSPSGSAYSVKWLKARLKEKYKEHIVFSELQGRSDVVCLKDVASYFINEEWYARRHTNADNEGMRIVETAAKIILGDIRKEVYNTDFYPSLEDVQDIGKGEAYLPDTLRLFLELLIKPRVKMVSIGQAIIQTARPRSALLPIPFSLGVEMDHVFGSRCLINELARLGLSVGYDEVTRFKQNILEHDDVNCVVRPQDNEFIQWVADNVDHNVATLDGKSTFHGMGVIAVSTPPIGEVLEPSFLRIVRGKLRNKYDFTKKHQIQIHQFIAPNVSPFSGVIFKPINHLMSPYSFPSDCTTDLLWQAAHLCKLNVPSWSGFMQAVSRGDHSGQSNITFLPLINMNPSDPSCILSTLLFICRQAEQLRVETPSVTFDQPLYIKGVEIALAYDLNIVLRLGGFHLLMSFLGSIGYVMEGSGLREVLETIYASSSVTHMMSGKAIARSLRGHFLVQAALLQMLMNEIKPCEHANESVDVQHAETSCIVLQQDDVESISELYEKVTENPESKAYDSSDALDRYSRFLSDLLRSKEGQSRTSKLWIQYIEYVDIVKDFIRSERTGNWSFHLATVSRMLNLLAATGHVHYAKTACLYLQFMLQLPETHPFLYAAFQDHGYHSIRRSDRFWAGLWSDLVIEQVLMRSLKSKGGLSRGRGMTENVNLVWTNTMHQMAGFHEAMTKLTGLLNVTSHQHVDLRPSRVQRDQSDLKTVSEWFEFHNPFPSTVDLISIANGMSATSETINCDSAEEIGARIQTSLDGCSLLSASIRRKDRVKTLGLLKEAVPVGTDQVVINPHTLFSRLIVLVHRENDMVPYFRYELAPYPTSLFKDGMMRESAKSKLRAALTKDVDQTPVPTANIHHVVDGGALLHKIKWLPKSTFSDVFGQYKNYLLHKFGLCSVIFDGYSNGPSTKDHEHHVRGSTISAQVHFTSESEVKVGQDKFLANPVNKAKFIEELGSRLVATGFDVRQSEGDADTLIVSASLEYANKLEDVVVHADDTDIFCMLMYHWKQDEMGDIYFQTFKSSTTGICTWKMKDVIDSNPIFVKQLILFLHAWTGCDTTSSCYKIGKISLITKMAKGPILQQTASMFLADSSIQEDIGNAGVEIFLNRYNSKAETLEKARYTKYMEMAATCISIEPAVLPPTPRAAHFHSLRVYHQVMVWKHLDQRILDPLQWGWQNESGHLSPIQTDLPAGPDDLLQFIRCNCKMTTKRPCTKNCSCYKHGLHCVPACKHCQGQSCENKMPTPAVEDMISDDEETYTDGNIFEILSNI